MKIRFEGIYYYDVSKGIELQESEGTLANLFKINDISFLYDTSLNRRSRCIVQNNQIPENEDLEKTLKAIMSVIKAKRNKSGKKNSIKTTKNTFDLLPLIVLASLKQSSPVKKDLSRKRLRL